MSKVCAYCDVRFKKGDQKSKCNGLEYHQNCFRCATCHEPITSAVYNLGKDEYRCSACQKKIDIVLQCSRCRQSIDNQPYIEYNGKPVHAGCFTCESCSEPLGDQLYINNDNQPYCVPCHMEQFAQLCATCGRGLPPGVSARRCGDLYFHVECFRCFHCGNIILSGKCKVNEENRRICKECYED